jgi:molybdopterin-binding protein
MNATAAAGCTPRAQRRPAIGTEAHSHPGSAVPARAALGTANTAEDGSSRANTVGDTSAVMAPLTRTPSTRKGRAWVTMATNTVVQVRNATGLSEPVSVPREYRATTTSSTTSRPSTRRRGRPAATAWAASSRPGVDFMVRDSRLHAHRLPGPAQQPDAPSSVCPERGRLGSLVAVVAIPEDEMELSARNQLQGTVKSVTLGTVMAEVVVDVNGQEIVSAITRGSAERLGLREGSVVRVIIKSTDVLLAN